MWRLPLESLTSRHAIAGDLKDLVSQVHRVSERKERYLLARERALRKPMPGAAEEEEARPVVPEIDWRVDLGELIARTDESLMVISVWLMKKDRGSGRAISLVGEVYDAAKEFQWAIANTRAPPSTATNKRFPTSSAYAISGVGIISFPFSVACTQCR
jgi:hypothetical protein